jgi:hypothetical protein
MLESFQKKINLMKWVGNGYHWQLIELLESKGGKKR